MKTLFTLLLLFTLLYSNLNAQWFQQTSGTTEDLYSVSSGDWGVGWISGANGTVLRTTDFGANWTSVGSSTFSSLPLYTICGKTENIALVSGSNSTGAYVYKTTNGGQNWVQVFFQAGGFINALHLEEFGNTGFMQGDPVTGRWSLWKTTDNGSTWDSAGLFLSQSGTEAGWNNSFYVFHSGRYSFGTNNSRIYYTTNNGQNWTAQITPIVNTYNVSFSTYAGIGGGEQLIRTTNDGMNWSTSSVPGSGNILSSLGLEFGLWYTRGSEIYFSSNAGLNWTLDTTIIGTQINDMEYIVFIITDNGYHVWAVGTGGKIYVTDYLLNVQTLSTTLPGRYSLSQNYPNPFNPSTKINFDIVRAGFVSVKVYNSIGQQVAELVNQDMTPGSYQADFDASSLTSGIYFYTIKAGDFVETKKMVLMK